ATERLASMMATAITPVNFDFFTYKEDKPDYTIDGLIESTESLKELFDEGIMAQNSVEVGTTDADAHFAVGANAFWISGSWTGNQLINDHNFSNWGVTSIPTKDGKPYYFPGASETDGLQVNNDTEHWEVVKVFLEYELENLHEILYVNTGLGVPANMGFEGDYAFEQQADIAEQELTNVMQALTPELLRRREVHRPARLLRTFGRYHRRFRAHLQRRIRPLPRAGLQRLGWLGRRRSSVQEAD